MGQRIDDALELAVLGDDLLTELLQEAHEIDTILREMLVEVAIDDIPRWCGAFLTVSIDMPQYNTEQAIRPRTPLEEWGRNLITGYWDYLSKWASIKEICSISQTESVNEYTIHIDAPYAYGLLKHESGIHIRTDLKDYPLQAEVSVVPAFDSSINFFNRNDIQVDVFRTAGPGGPWIVITDSAVRITHLPTGIQARANDKRSQLQNRNAALQLLNARLWAFENGKNISKEKVRTYAVSHGFVRDERSQQDFAIEGKLSENLDMLIQNYLQYKICT